MFQKEHAVCFSGYRLHKFADTDSLPCIQERLGQAVKSCIDKGFSVFYVGMADGFDMMAAEEVVKCKELYAHIRFVAVIPCHNWREFSQHEKNVLDKADEVIAVAQRGGVKSYHKRNRYMVDNAAVLICYYSGSAGGTRYTVTYAQQKKLEIINIWSDVSSHTAPAYGSVQEP